MRSIIAIVIIAIVAVVGLYVYGLTLRPDVQTIEQDAVRSADV